MEVQATSDINVDDIFTVGNKLVMTIKGKSVFTHSFCRNDKVKTLGSMSLVKLTDKHDSIKVDPALLFQRLYLLANVDDVNVKDTLKYELCAYPPSLFESTTMLRKADKSQLAMTIRKYVDSKLVADGIPVPCMQSEQYVLDGGSLLHRIPWHKGDTFDTTIHHTLNLYTKSTVLPLSCLMVTTTRRQ